MLDQDKAPKKMPKLKVSQCLVDFRDILLQLKLSDDINRKGIYEKDIAILMWQTTIEEEIRVKPEMPVHCRNDYIEGMLTFLVEA